jgi:hypothetical protein
VLPIPERTRLLGLIGLQRRGELTPELEAQMRAIIASEYPKEARELPLEHAIQLGLGMAAVHFFFPEESGLRAAG